MCLRGKIAQSQGLSQIASHVEDKVDEAPQRIINNTISHINIGSGQYNTNSWQYLKLPHKHCMSISKPSRGIRWFHMGGLWRPCITPLPLSRHIFISVGVHNRSACYKTRQRDCIIDPLLKLCNHLLSNTFDLLMKSKVA